MKTVAPSPGVGYNLTPMAAHGSFDGHLNGHLKPSAGKALGQIPSGLFVLTAKSAHASAAMMASWVQQASFVPPTLSIAIARGRPISQIVHQTKKLAVSIVAENDFALMKKYARGIGPDEDPFAGVQTLVSPGGIAVLKSSLGWLELKIIGQCDFGADHELVIGEVVAGDLLSSAEPMVHTRNSGFHY